MAITMIHKQSIISVRRRRGEIIRMRREGYKIWRIAEAIGVDEYFVAAVLVSAGLGGGNIDATMSAEVEPTKESIAAKLRRMRRTRCERNKRRRKT